MITRPCPRCGQPTSDWRPWKVMGELSLSFQCKCGHGWQINGCSVLFPPEGKPPEQFPPIDSID